MDGIFSKVTPVQMGGVLRYKWEAYCGTNWRCTAAFPFLQGLEASKAQRYKWGAYCGTNWRCTAVLFRQVERFGLVAQCCATPASVAATPPVVRHRFRGSLTCDTPGSSRATGVTGPLGGV